jgi:hypothetical protein
MDKSVEGGGGGERNGGEGKGGERSGSAEQSRSLLTL